jgi:cell division protein FtsX
LTGGWLGRRLLGELRRHRAAVLSMAITFAMIALLGGGDRIFARLVSSGALPAARPRAELLVYLRDDVGAAAGQALEQALVRVPGVLEVKSVGAAEALARMRQELGPRARLLDGADDGLLPASLEVSLAGGPGGDLGALGVRARQLGARLQALPGVLDVDVVEPRAGPSLGRWSTAVGWLRAGPLALTALGALGALAWMVVAGRARRRDEMKLLLALGFTRRAAFLPAVLSSVIAAVGGAALGLAALRLGWRLLGVMPAAAGGRFLSPAECAVGLGAALGLGALLGYVTVRRPDTVDAAI